MLFKKGQTALNTIEFLRTYSKLKCEYNQPYFSHVLTIESFCHGAFHRPHNSDAYSLGKTILNSTFVTLSLLFSD